MRLPGEKPRLLRILRELDLPEGQWVLNGSGVLVMHGIERDRPMGDVDIFVATRLWFDLYHASLMAPPSDGQQPPWSIFTTDPDDPKRRCDPPYLFRDMHGIEVNVFSNWRRRSVGDIDVNWSILNAEMIEGIPCYPLRGILDWKEQVGRAKDSTDIAAIRRHLEHV